MAPTYIPERGCRPPGVGHRPVGTCTHVSGEPGHHMYVHRAGDSSGEPFCSLRSGVDRWQLWPLKGQTQAQIC